MATDRQFGTIGQLEISVSRIPLLLTEFAIFLQYRQLEDRLVRAKQKLRGLAGRVPGISARYAFHESLQVLYARKNRGQKIRVDDLATYHALSFMIGVLAAASQMGESARMKLRSAILGGLRVDQEFRAIEHEIRCFTHFRQNNFSVQFADYEGLGRYDFLATRGSEIEIECKLVSPDMGHPIRIDQSVAVFEGILGLRARETGVSLPAGVTNSGCRPTTPRSFRLCLDFCFSF